MKQVFIKSSIKWCSVLLVTIVSISCTSKAQIDDQTKLKLKEVKSEIIGYLDSSNYYFDKMISELKNGGSSVEINGKYNRKIEILESKINQAIEKINTLGREGKITVDQFNKWVEGIDTDKLSQKSKLVKELNINLDDLPVTNVYELTQKHVDSTYRFSIKFPENWLLMDDYQDFDLMATGTIEDTATGETTTGAFGVSVKELDTAYSTQGYCEDNLATIKRQYDTFQMLEEKTIDIDGIEAKYVVFKCIVKNGLDYTSLQIYFIKNNTGFILGGGAPTDEFDKLRDAFIEIARTFEVD